MRLVDEQKVGPGLFEGQSFVGGLGRDDLLDPGLGVFDRLLDLFDRELRALAVGGVEGVAQLTEFAFEVLDLRFAAHGDATEHRLRHDHQVPVPNGALPDEALPVIAPVQVGGDEDVGVRIGVAGLDRPLPEQVIGHHDPRLADLPETCGFHARGGDRQGLAGPDHVVEQDRLVVQEPCHGGGLVVVRRVLAVHAGERLAGRVVDRLDVGVVALVEDAGQAHITVTVLPQPFFEPLLQGCGRGLRLLGELDVEPRLRGTFELVAGLVDLDRFVVGEQLDHFHARQPGTAVLVRVATGEFVAAALIGGDLPVSADLIVFDGQPIRAQPELLDQERAIVLDRHPGRADAHPDLGGIHIRRHHLRQRLHQRRVARIVAGFDRRPRQLGAHLPGQGNSGQFPPIGVVQGRIDLPLSLLERVLDGHLQQLGDSPRRDVSELVEADRQRLVDIGGTGGLVLERGGVLGEDRRLGRHRVAAIELRLEVLDGQHHAQAWIPGDRALQMRGIAARLRLLGRLLVQLLVHLVGDRPGVGAGLRRIQPVGEGLLATGLDPPLDDRLVEAGGDLVFRQRGRFGELEAVQRPPPAYITVVERIEATADDVAVGDGGGARAAGLGQLHHRLTETDEDLPLLGQVLAAAGHLRPAATEGELLEAVLGFVEAHRTGQHLVGIEVGSGAQPRRGERFDLRRIGGRGGESESATEGLVDDRVELLAQLRRQRLCGGGGNAQRRPGVHAVAHRQGAQHPLGVLLEVGVDPRASGFAGLGVDRLDLDGGCGPVESVLGGGGTVVAAAEHQHVGDHVGAGLPVECPGGQAHRPDQIPLGDDRGAFLGAAGIGGEHRGDHRDVATGSGQRQRFGDEVVVDRQTVRVVDRVDGREPAERDVADRPGEGVLGGEVAFEAVVADLLRGIQVVRDLRADRLDLDADHAHRLRCGADEVAGPAARLEHQSTIGQSGPRRRPPQFRHHRRVGVVGVEGGLAGLRETLLPEQIEQFGVLVAPLREDLRAVVEDLRDRAPAGPPRQHRLLVGGRRSLLLVELAHQTQGGDVRPRPGLRPSGDQHLGTEGEVLRIDGRRHCTHCRGRGSGLGSCLVNGGLWFDAGSGGVLGGDGAGDPHLCAGFLADPHQLARVPPQGTRQRFAVLGFGNDQLVGVRGRGALRRLVGRGGSVRLGGRHRVRCRGRVGGRGRFRSRGRRGGRPDVADHQGIGEHPRGRGRIGGRGGRGRVRWLGGSQFDLFEDHRACVFDRRRYNSRGGRFGLLTNLRFCLGLCLGVGVGVELGFGLGGAVRVELLAVAFGGEHGAGVGDRVPHRQLGPGLAIDVGDVLAAVRCPPGADCDVSAVGVTKDHISGPGEGQVGGGEAVEVVPGCPNVTQDLRVHVVVEGPVQIDAVAVEQCGLGREIAAQLVDDAATHVLEERVGGNEGACFVVLPQQVRTGGSVVELVVPGVGDRPGQHGDTGLGVGPVGTFDPLRDLDGAGVEQRTDRRPRIAAAGDGGAAAVEGVIPAPAREVADFAVRAVVQPQGAVCGPVTEQSGKIRRLGWGQVRDDVPAHLRSEALGGNARGGGDEIRAFLGHDFERGVDADFDDRGVRVHRQSGPRAEQWITLGVPGHPRRPLRGGVLIPGQLGAVDALPFGVGPLVQLGRQRVMLEQHLRCGLPQR